MNNVVSKKAITNQNNDLFPTIIVAEDDDGHAELISKNLQRAGLINNIERAIDGQDAIDRIYGEGAYKEAGAIKSFILLLDINMPRLSGPDVLKKLKENSITASVPVIILTTTDDPREIQHCYDLGCNIYITKPIDYEAFAEAVKRLGLFLQVIAYPDSV